MDQPGGFTDALQKAKASDAYIAQEKRLLALQKGYSVSLAAIWTMASRSAPMLENSLSFAFIHDAFQTMAAVTFMATEGAFAPAKRELRYLLEAAAKHAHVDLQLGGSSLANRIAFLESHVPRSSMDFILTQKFFGLSAQDEVDFKASVVGKYSELSAFVHRSPMQLRAELALAGTGPPEPTRVAADLEQFNRHCVAVYDAAVFLQFQVLGPGLAGDVFVRAFDDVPQWPFHRTKYCKKLSQFYDYKVERTQNQVERDPGQ